MVLAYREGLPNALDGVSLMVRPGEKVGIVGRTGSGKSTLFLALFRMVELNRGQILLDGLDIRSVGLAQLRFAVKWRRLLCNPLSVYSVTKDSNIIVCRGDALFRSRLAIIPQDPFLFSGTVRENLDPCGQRPDQQLLDVLDQCHLSSTVARMGEKLSPWQQWRTGADVSSRGVAVSTDTG